MLKGFSRSDDLPPVREAKHDARTGCKIGMKILLVSHFFPPLRAISSIRTYGWARCWADMGHEVHVLTSIKYAFDGPLDLDLPVDNVHVHAVPYPCDSGRGAADSVHQSSRTPRWEKLKLKTRRLRHKLGILGDVRILLVPALVRKGSSLASDTNFDLIVSNFGPASNMIVASALARRLRLPWVADYHDLWSESYVTPRRDLCRKVSMAFERLVMRRASLLVAVSHGVAHRLEKTLGRPAVVAYFGYLSSRDNPPSPIRSLWLDKLQLVYAGRVYERHQTVDVFFRSLAKVLARRPTLQGQLLVHFFGPDQPVLAKMAQACGVSSVIRLHGNVPQGEALAIEASAAALLFFDWKNPSEKGVLTGKFFEYLRSKRPIIFIGSGSETEASDLGRRTGAAIILQSAVEIERFFVEWPSMPLVTRDEAVISQLSCHVQAQLLLSEVGRRLLAARQGQGMIPLGEGCRRP